MIEQNDAEWSSDPLSPIKRLFRDIFVFSEDEELFIARGTTRHSWHLPYSDLNSFEPGTVRCIHERSEEVEQKEKFWIRRSHFCITEAPPVVPGEFQTFCPKIAALNYYIYLHDLGSSTRACSNPI